MRITPSYSYLLLLLSFFSITSNAQLTVNGYTNHTIAGFDVLVEDIAMTTDSTKTNAAISLLQTKLNEILQFNIDQVKKDSLLAVPIFMDWNTTTGAAQYHPSRTWLINNGFAPEKAMCVEISNITNFINWTNQNQPYMVLHELTHAYHHRVLNFNSSVITNAFNNAVSNNLYKNVSYHTGGGNYITQASAYALNNEIEYFAEVTEAYFGLNDYFPFDYDDLKTYDSIGFAAAVTIWGNYKLSNTQPKFYANELNVYPNPSEGIITLSIENQNINTLQYELIDPSGRKIIAPVQSTTSSSITLNLSTSPAGLYFFRLVQDKNVKTFKIIKN